MIASLIYLASVVLFILGLKRLAKVKTARQGNTLSAGAMLLAVLGTFVEMGAFDPTWVIMGLLVGTVVGVVVAQRVEMTAMPEMVAIFNGLGGLASALVPLSEFWQRYVAHDWASHTGSTSVAAVMGSEVVLTLALSILIGAVTFTGSMVAFLKLQGTLQRGEPILLPLRHQVNIALAAGVVVFGLAFGFLPMGALLWLLVIIGASFVLGVTLVIPIGGADMPVVVSLLNSYSGVAAAMAGFVIGKPLLIIGGAMVGASGLILTRIMCVAMNRSLINVLLGGFGQQASAAKKDSEYTSVTISGAEEAAMLLDTAQSVVVVPGYGLAVAQAQHSIRELADFLKAKECNVRYAIHPVAGRMPGHMNVLLAEADVPYEELVEMDDINPDFKNTDVAIVLGANDVVNPDAINDKSSPIYGMPILNVHEARTVFVVKRSLSPGYAGIKNPLFEADNSMMLFGDAKKMVQDIHRELKEM